MLDELRQMGLLDLLRVQNLPQSEWIFAVAYRRGYSDGKCLFELRSGQSSCLNLTFLHTYEKGQSIYKINFKWKYRTGAPSTDSKELNEHWTSPDRTGTLIHFDTLLSFKNYEAMRIS